MTVDLIKNEQGKLTKVNVKTPVASAEIYLFGANLTSWIVNGQERIFLSKKSCLDGTRSITGGIPIVFPQFKHKVSEDLPFHGFAQSTIWQWGGVKVDTPEKTEVEFILTEKDIDEAYRKVWPFNFKLIYTITLQDVSLSTNIKIENTGKDKLVFNILLHTYMNVKDLSKAGVKSLKGFHYLDTTTAGNFEEKIEDRDVVVFQSEVDNIYHEVTATDFELNTGCEKVVKAEKRTFPNIVIWNPWVEKARTFLDFGEESYPHMFCFEVGCVYKFIDLEAGKSYEGGQTLTVA